MHISVQRRKVMQFSKELSVKHYNNFLRSYNIFYQRDYTKFFSSFSPSYHLNIYKLCCECQNKQTKTKQHCNYERHSGIFFDCVTISWIPLSKHNIVIYVFLTGVIRWVFSNDFLLLVRSAW